MKNPIYRILEEDQCEPQVTEAERRELGEREMNNRSSKRANEFG
jgi:hypothetical protein